MATGIRKYFPLLPSSIDVCADQCRAKCCRAPGFVPLASGELGPFKAKFPDVVIKHSKNLNAYIIDFTANGGQCPALTDSFQCGIYEDRPGACHMFPSEATHGCLIWPGEPGDPPILAFESDDPEHQAEVLAEGIEYFKKMRSDPRRSNFLGPAIDALEKVRKNG